MSSPITYAQASAAQISRLCGKIDSLMEGEDPDQVNIACLAMALLISVPEISAGSLIEGVKGASEWVALFGQSLRNERAN